ncbi:diguanylate cyclase domain-containing protein [Vibrio mangrovi]|uniref:diguanylate cyclase n=1 Tax=Vibrio mangrovi TaxID=474394 RepID=A0A1Y6IW99_9VIBR|nr:diguanylate cyclase [Vibrio mangrovi]MDW6001650.1 diguanylate cyclase [Vibrio mangrovi]SMS00323.1 Phytochrome-like protein cph2 [Vibrio mangrovi]
MRLKNLGLRWLVSSMSLCVVILFLIFYFAFKYAWTHEKQAREARYLQRMETERVETLLEMKGAEMTSALADYAAWNDMAAFIRSPDDTFKTDSMNLHALISVGLNGFFMYDPDFKLVWGLRYDYRTQSTIGFDDLDFHLRKILQETSEMQEETVQPILRFLVINGSPYLVASSRVCNSQGYQCHSGYMIFLQEIRQSFIQEIEKATGLILSVLVESSLEPLTYPTLEDNISYIEKHGYRDDMYVLIRIHHDVQLPSFLDWEEVSALVGFSVLMFMINLYVVNYLVSPIRSANQVLEKFKISGGKMPKANTFLSKEMRAFSQTINSIVDQLEKSRQELQWQSEHDPLTRIANRRRLEKDILRFIEECHYPHMLLFLADIDHFKQYNDHYGHMEGDFVLQKISRAFSQFPFDEEMSVARFGGEEFCIVLASDHELDGSRYAEQLVRLIESLNIPHACSPTQPILTISVGGIVIEHPDAEDYLQFFHEADSVLYQAKALGRARFVVQPFTKNSD